MHHCPRLPLEGNGCPGLRWIRLRAWFRRLCDDPLGGLLPTGGSACLFAAASMAMVATGFTPAAGYAQVKEVVTMYTCRDASGRVLSSDRPLPECANQPIRQMNANGIVTKEIPAPLTPEQLRRKAIADEMARVDAIRQRQSDARDRALLVAYANLDMLENARQRQLTDLRREIDTAQKRMISSHQELNAANTALANLPATASKDAARRNIRLIAQGILADDAAVTRLRGELAEVDRRFDDDRLRLRQLLRDPDPMIQASRPAPTAR